MASYLIALDFFQDDGAEAVRIEVCAVLAEFGASRVFRGNDCIWCVERLVPDGSNGSSNTVEALRKVLRTSDVMRLFEPDLPSDEEGGLYESGFHGVRKPS